MKRYGKFEAKGRKVKNNPQQYASTGAIHQVVSFKGSEHTQSYPKKPSKYQTMECTRDQPSPCETMELSDQPIYEETF